MARIAFMLLIVTAPAWAGPAATSTPSVAAPAAAASSTPASTAAASTSTPATASGPAKSELPALPPLDQMEKAKLRAGVVISRAKEEETGGELLGWAFAKCPPSEVFAVITHHADFPEFMPRLKSVQVLRHDEATGERAVQTIDASIQSVTYGLDYTWSKDVWHMDFVLAQDLPHEVAAVRGHWQLWPQDDGKATLIEYASAVEVGRYVPGFIRSYLADRGLKDTIDAVRKRAESRLAPKPAQ